MERLLNSYKLSHTRITAVDGLDSMNSEFKNLCMPNIKLSAPENACTCSHLKAMKYFVEQMTDDKIIIFEDDVSFEFLKLIPFNWSDLEKNFPENYDVIQLAITYESGAIDNMLVKINPAMRYFCSAAYLVTRDAAKKMLERYYVPNLNKINLALQPYATADAMISSTGHIYSIPIFTYLTTESTIHPLHLYNHNKSKKQQLLKWKETMKKCESFNVTEYFLKFPKN